MDVSQLTLLDQDHKCPKCDRHFKNVGHLKCHLFKMHSECRLASFTVKVPVVCRLCDVAFSSKKLLLRHSCKCTVTLHKCDVCNASFTNKSGLVRHCITVHTIKKPYVCDMCNKEFDIKALLITHCRAHARRRSCKDAIGTDFVPVEHALSKDA